MFFSIINFLPFHLLNAFFKNFIHYVSDKKQWVCQIEIFFILPINIMVLQKFLYHKSS